MFELIAPVAELLARFMIDIAAMGVLIFGLYYRRYRDRELATTASMFNIFAFAVLTILSSVEFSVAAGFGLFAILALFSRTLRRYFTQGLREVRTHTTASSGVYELRKPGDLTEIRRSTCEGPSCRLPSEVRICSRYWSISF